MSPISRLNFDFGYRYTLPQEYSNLAVLGPSSGFVGMGDQTGDELSACCVNHDAGAARDGGTARLEQGVGWMLTAHGRDPCVSRAGGRGWPSPRRFHLRIRSQLSEPACQASQATDSSTMTKAVFTELYCRRASGPCR